MREPPHSSSFTTHQHAKGHTKHKTFTPRTHHTRFIQMLADVRRVPRSQTRIRVATPRVNPGSEPVQPDLTRQACGPWRTHRHNTYIQIYRLRRHRELMIHRNRRAGRPHQRGHHRAEPEGADTVAAVAEAARAGEAEQQSKMGAPGVAGRRRGSDATSGRPQQRVLVERQNQGPSGSSGRAGVQPTKLGQEGPEGWNCRYAVSRSEGTSAKNRRPKNSTGRSS